MISPAFGTILVLVAPKPRSCQKLEKTIFEYFFELCHHFTFWDVCAIYLVVMGTKAGEINFKYFFHTRLNRKSCRQNQDRAKRWGNQFLNTFWIQCCWERRCHQNKDRARSWKIQFLNVFLIEFWIVKSCRQNQDRSKRWRKSISEYFSTWIYIYIYIYTSFLLIWSVQQKDQEKCLWHLFCEKRMWNFTFWDVCAIYLVVMRTKAGEINFEYFLIKCWIEKAAAKTKIVPKAGK